MNKHLLVTVLTVCSIILASSILMPSPSFAQGINPNALIANGSFEQDFLGWSSWICTDCSSIDTSTIHDGSNSYSVDTTTTDHGSSISQPLPSGIKDFVFSAYVYRTQGSNTLELLSDWSPTTGYANFITRVDFADSSTGTVALEAWNTRTVTDILWPSDGWHELVILADWARARQSFLLDNVLIGTVQASTVFSPEHVVLGDVGGWNNGHHSHFHYDGVSLTSEHPCAVPFFSQVDDNWYNHPLGGNDVCSSYCSTIGRCGCTLTSAAMVFNAYGADLTPPQLNDCMDRSACPFGWAVGATCSDSGVRWTGRAAFSWNRLDQELSENHRPVILGMCKKGTCQLDHDDDPNTYAQTHWVVVLGGQGDNPEDYQMHDPAFKCGASLPLSTRSEDWEFTQMGLYDGSGQCSSLLPLTPSCASRGVNPQPVQFDPPSSTTTHMGPLSVDNPASPSSTISGTLWMYTRTEVTMTLEMTATSSVGNVTDMVIWSDTMPNTNWQPFAPFVWLPVSESVFARVRDNLGNITDVFSNTINPAGPPSAGPQVFLPTIKWNVGEVFGE